ncbi:hypothetical protein [Marinovum sp.]|uniref:hypothetical protein n=1 Tax=Marinovum sp. TaxID=2024839 RepID=UPI003A8FF29C
MHRTITPLILAAALGLPAAASAAPFQFAPTATLTETAPNALLVEVKDKKDKGAKKAKKAAKKKAKAHKKARKAVEKAAKKEAKSEGKAKVKIKSDDDKSKVKVEVKDGKDKAKIEIDGTTAALAALAAPLAALGTAGLADILIDCPPGLAKKAVPCVPPGQVDRQATAQEWTSRDEEELRVALTESQRIIDTRYQEEELELVTLPEFDPDATTEARIVEETETARIIEDTDSDSDSDDESRLINERILGLTQNDIIALFDLDPAPAGAKYVVIDGRPVLLDEENYVRVRSLRHLDDVDLFEVEADDLTAAIGHNELLEIYDLPDPGTERYYSMVDGEVLLLPAEGYELLQLLRVVALAPSLAIAQAG